MINGQQVHEESRTSRISAMEKFMHIQVYIHDIAKTNSSNLYIFQTQTSPTSSDPEKGVDLVIFLFPQS